ncbi:Tripartite tricarboxylate transporter TctB family protein [Neomoorella glycerini]|uniref:Tripartite tricarboxylate transporter TctB family protein n=1 Tax=Neomoorella glycerini TaxID=55779 RepID=A0A6I5ZNK6_9FIRM|nr:tripartite tricarboxylate transporter TctB family protein [Moorella glycerini]QGP91492.1 Tripartite tricarboxylate transporter TctB family protein [Moorella glycerini]
MGKDRVSSLVLAGISLLFLIYSRQYDLGTLASPGEAVFPMLVAIAVLLLAGWLFLSSGRGNKPEGEKNEAVNPGNGRRVLILTLVIALALLAMEFVGFFTTSFVLALLCCRILGVKEWFRAVGIAAGAALGAYLIFGLWLKVSFPVGLLL